MLEVFRKFWLLPLAVKGQLLQSVFVVIFFRLALDLVGYNKIRGLIAPATDTATPDIAFKLAWCVTRAAKIVPGAVCLSQAVALQYLLARRGFRSNMRIGVKTDKNGEFLAHAWLISGDRVVIGGDLEELKSFTPLIDLCPAPQ